MIDILLVADDRDTLLAALAGRSYWGLPLVQDGGLHPAYAMEPRIYVLPGTSTTVTNLDGTTTDVPDRTYLPHAYAWVSIPARDPELEALPIFGLCADRAAFERGDPGFVLASTFTSDQLAASYIEPVPAGTRYPFGSPIVAA